jgi:hypothetical protein
VQRDKQHKLRTLLNASNLWRVRHGLVRAITKALSVHMQDPYVQRASIQILHRLVCVPIAAKIWDPAIGFRDVDSGMPLQDMHKEDPEEVHEMLR